MKQISDKEKGEGMRQDRSFDTNTDNKKKGEDPSIITVMDWLKRRLEISLQSKRGKPKDKFQ